MWHMSQWQGTRYVKPVSVEALATPTTLGLAILLLLPNVADARPSGSHVLTGQVVKTTDGDTIHVLDDTTRYKIRLQGIDAPERK